MKSKRIGVLMGGWSSEREVSLSTGEGVAAALEGRGHKVSRLVWEKDGPGLDQLVRKAGVDVMFVALHCWQVPAVQVSPLSHSGAVPQQGSSRPPQSVHSGVPNMFEQTRSVDEQLLLGGQHASPSWPQGWQSSFVQTRSSPPTIEHWALAATQTLGVASSSQQPPVH